MEKQAINLLMVRYSMFVHYMSGLPEEQYLYSAPGKWAASQQLEHIVLCVKPLLAVFSMEKPAIAQAFGTTDRESRTYDVLLADYYQKLADGGKAPARFVPGPPPPQKPPSAKT